MIATAPVSISRLNAILSESVKTGVMSDIEAMTLHACVSATYRLIRHEEANEFQTQWGKLSVETVKDLFKDNDTNI